MVWFGLVDEVPDGVNAIPPAPLPGIFACMPFLLPQPESIFAHSVSSRYFKARAGEVAQQLRALCSSRGPKYAAPTWWLSTACNSRSRSSDALCWPRQAPGTHMWHTDTQTGSRHTHLQSSFLSPFRSQTGLELHLPLQTQNSSFLN